MLSEGRSSVAGMRIILVPGFWLDGSSWDDITPPLVEAGHTVEPVTLPGAERENDHRAEVTLADQVDDVVARVDASVEPVVLVGHSGGGAVIHAVVDARPEAVTRAVYVDSLPLAAGKCINDELPVVDGVIPLPDWSVFDDADLVGMTPEIRDAFRRIAIDVPAHVAQDKQVLTDERRYDVPITVITCEFPSADLQAMAQDDDHPWHGYVHEVSLVRDVTWIDLPTGHWPQLTRPADLAAALADAVGPA